MFSKRSATVQGEVVTPAAMAGCSGSFCCISRSCSSRSAGPQPLEVVQLLAESVGQAGEAAQCIRSVWFCFSSSWWRIRSALGFPLTIWPLDLDNLRGRVPTRFLALRSSKGFYDGAVVSVRAQVALNRPTVGRQGVAGDLNRWARRAARSS